MMHKNRFLKWLGVVGTLVLFFGNGGYAQEESDYDILREIIVNEFQKEASEPHESQASAIVRRFLTKEKKAAIILEACFDTGVEIDTPLLKNFVEKKIAVSLFTDQAWLTKNALSLKPLMASGFLTLENHGLFCRPLSISGQKVKDHPGTADVSEVFEEVEKNARVIEKYSGRLPHFFKSGLSAYDDVSLKIVSVLGYQVVEGDRKLLSKDVVSNATILSFLEKLQPGSIIVMPANRPGKSAAWLPLLLKNIEKQGYAIVALEDVLGLDEEAK